MPWFLKIGVDWSFLRKYIRGARRFNEVTKEISDERLRDGEKGLKFNDIVAILRNAKEPETGQRLTTPELVSEAGLLLVAGKVDIHWILNSQELIVVKAPIHPA